MKKEDLTNKKKLSFKKTAIAKLSMSGTEMKLLHGGVINPPQTPETAYSLENVLGDCITKTNRPTTACPQQQTI